jgi:hypothetical protein
LDESANIPAGESRPPPAAGGYRNLWVPLVVVPFLVVGVIVLVFVFFGAIRGTEASMEENLQRAVHGGANERKQASVSLAAQALENSVALSQGRPPVWPAPANFLDDLLKAWDEMPSDDNPRIRLVVAQLSAQYGDPQALDKLAQVLAIEDSEDPSGELRVYAMLALTWLGDPRAADLIVPFLDHEDPFLRQSAAGALQDVPGETSRAALRRLLSDASLELRGQAAISLARLGDPSGADVLRELVRPESYLAESERAPGKFEGRRSVHAARIEGVRGLARLARPEDRELLAALAAGDEDPAVREAAMLALEGKVAAKEGRAGALPKTPANGAGPP